MPRHGDGLAGVEAGLRLPDVLARCACAGSAAPTGRGSGGMEVFLAWALGLAEAVVAVRVSIAFQSRAASLATGDLDEDRAEEGPRAHVEHSR